MLSLESLHRGDSNEYTQYTIFNMREREKHPKFCNDGIYSKGLINEFETAVVNEPSVFEPLKFYCTCKMFSNNNNLQFIILHFKIVPKGTQLNVTGFRLGISYTCTALRHKPAFIATW